MALINKPVIVPDMNPIRFVENEHPYAAYQTLYTDWWDNHIESPNVKTNFRQPWDFYDYIGVQVQLGGLYKIQQGETRLQVLDCAGKLLGEVAPGYFGQLAGNKITYNNIPFSMGTVNFATTVGQFLNGIEGIYYLRLALAYEFDTVLYYKYWTSEPLHFKQHHEGTRILEYFSFTNKHGVDYTSMFFHLRVPGEVKLDQIKYDGAHYRDQKKNPRQQSGQTYRSLVLNIGNGLKKGVPMWFLEKVSRAYDNDYVTCDKVRTVREDGAEIEIGNKVPRWERFPATLRLSEYDAEAKTLSVTSVPLILWPAYSGTGYCVHYGAMKNSGTNFTKNFFNGVTVKSTQNEDDMLGVFNNFAVPNSGLKGQFARIGSNICYVNGVGENFDTSTSVVFTKAFMLVYKKHSSAVINPSIWIEADRVSVSFKGFLDTYNGGSGTVGVYQQFHPIPTYTAADSYGYVEIFHDDGIKKLTLGTNTVANAAMLESIQVGIIPNLIEELDIVYPYLPNGLDFAAFPATMKKIFIRYGGPFFQAITSFNKNWTLLNTLLLDGNWFTPSMVDSMFNQHYNGNAYTPPTGMVFKINSQFPSGAPPTAASLTARTDLITNHSGVVITD